MVLENLDEALIVWRGRSDSLQFDGSVLNLWCVLSKFIKCDSLWRLRWVMFLYRSNIKSAMWCALIRFGCLWLIGNPNKWKRTRQKSFSCSKIGKVGGFVCIGFQKIGDRIFMKKYQRQKIDDKMLVTKCWWDYIGSNSGINFGEVDGFKSVATVDFDFIFGAAK